MAPEQAEGKVHAIGPQTDIYSLGAILYELLTGRPPFQGATLLETLEQVRTQEPRPPSSWRPKLPRDLDTICLKCLEKEAHRRYASALELAEELRRYLRGEFIHARPISLGDRLARTLSREQQVVQFLALGKLLRWLVPVPFLTHLLGFLLVRNGWPAVTALGMTFSTLVIMLAVILVANRYEKLLPTGPALRDFWSFRISHWVGLVLLPFLCYLMSTPERPWDPLTSYPLWTLIAGVAIFGMGSSFWGRFYIIGLLQFVFAFVMALNLEWSVLEFGVMVSAVFAFVAGHLQRISSQRQQETKTELPFANS
jgi:hypothetical protein